MKYLEQFIEEKYRIKVLGNLTTTSCSEGETVGLSLVIDGYEPGIEVWYADYCIWLEEKYEQLLKVGEVGDDAADKNLKFDEFRDDVMSAMMKEKPTEIRKGQFVFNYIDSKYGVARAVQISEGIDCFFDDSKIEAFIKKAFKIYNKKIYG